MLALARADAGISLPRQRVEVDRLVLEAVKEARHLARGQKIEVDKLEPAVLLGDGDRLKQLLLILLDNAVKYTPAGGRVSVELGRRSRIANILVRDTGVGIPDDALPHLFERFYRADPARARDPGGTGLGLSIAQWIVDQHGGRIEVQSCLGVGTTVTVMLPITA
jgi:signal transduction histidine kinase